MNIEAWTGSAGWLRAGWTMVHFLWIGALIGAIAMASRLVLLRADARIRYAAALGWMVVLALTPIAIALRLERHNQPAERMANATAQQLTPSASASRVEHAGAAPRAPEASQSVAALSSPPSSAGRNAAPATWIGLLPWAWLTGGAVMLAWSFLGLIGAERLRRRSATPAAGEIDSICGRLAVSLRVTRHVSVKICDLAIAPILIGIVRPTILLPAALASGLPAAQIEMILLHELAHVRRWDNLVNLVQRMIESVLFFQPAIWVVSSWVRSEREHCCDDVVMRLRADRVGYADALLAAARVMTGHWPIAGVAATGSPMAGRLRRILRGGGESRERMHVGPGAAAVVLLLGIASVIYIGSAARAADAEKNVLLVSKEKDAKYTTIQAAIDAAPDGAVVRVGPGVYAESVLIKKPLTLEGAGWDKTTIAVPNDKAADVAAAMRDAEKNVKAAKARPELQKALAEIQQQFLMPCVAVENTHDVIIRGLKITSTPTVFPDNGGIGGATLVRTNTSKLAIQNCAIVGSPGDGIRFGDGSDATIENSLVAAAWGTGIVIASSNGSKVTARVIGCDVRNCYYAGITSGSDDEVTIEKCRISGAAWHGIRYYGGSAVVKNNILWGNARTGIYANASAKGATVEGNLFYRNEWDGIACWDLNVDRIIGNTFAYNGRDAVSALGGATPVVDKNVFFENETAISGGKISGNSPTNQIAGKAKMSGNVFWQNRVTIVEPVGEGEKATTRAVKPDAATGSTEVDPKFVAPADGNFTMAADSAVRKAGAGASELPAFASPWAITPEEKLIIPDGPGRQYDQWKRPAGSTK